MSALSAQLDTYRSASITEREKGTYFEELICTYRRNEATYRDLYGQVWTYAEWAKENELSGKDPVSTWRPVFRARVENGWATL